MEAFTKYLVINMLNNILVLEQLGKEQIGEKCSDLWRFTNDSDLFEAKQ